MENENEEIKRKDNEKGKVDSSTKKGIVIDSKNKKGPKNITLKVKIADLPEGTQKDDIIAVIKSNGEKEQKEEEKKKFKPRYLLPVAALLMIPVMLHSCGKNVDKINNQEPIEPTKIVETIDFELERYDIQDPYEILEGIVNSAGQEGLTSNVLEGNLLEGEQYSSEEQYKAETRATTNIQHFQEIKSEINENMQILIDEDSSKSQKEASAKKLLELDREVENIFYGNKEFAEKYTEKFAKASEAHRDDNTDNEEIAVNGMLENYKSEMGLSTYNTQQIQNIVDLYEQGYDLNISNEDVERDLRGTYKISGEAVREVAVKQDIPKSKSVWQKFANFAKGRTQEKVDKEVGKSDGR